jgi:hypothetical protein
MARARQIVRDKNADYGTDADPFANFKDVVEDGLTVERGMTVRMRDKMRRITNLLDKEATVKGETVNDSLLDLANYALIMFVWLEWKNSQ